MLKLNNAADCENAERELSELNEAYKLPLSDEDEDCMGERIDELSNALATYREP